MMRNLAVAARSPIGGRAVAPRRVSSPGARGGVLLVVLALAVTACAGTSPDRVAYNTIDTAVNAVQGALAVFNEAYQTAMLPVDGEPAESLAARRATWTDRRNRAKDAYEKFQTTARSGAILAEEALDPEHKASAIKLVSDAAVEALRIIEAFRGGK